MSELEGPKLRLTPFCTAIGNPNYDQDLSPGAATFIGAALARDTSIHMLVIQRLRGFDAEGGVALAEALKVNQTLQTLCFIEVDITHKGAIALAEMLKVNTTLKSLNLTPLSDASRYALYMALMDNTTLEKLNGKSCDVLRSNLQKVFEEKRAERERLKLQEATA